MPTAFNLLGLCCLGAGQARRAVDAFRRAILLSPRTAPLHHNLGLALRACDDSYGAIEAFKRAVKLEPRNETNYFQLYRQYFIVGAAEDCLTTLEEGVRWLPSSIPLRDALAATCCRAGQKERGEAIFRRLLEERPGYCNSYSIWLQEEGRFEESVGLLNRWIEQEPNQGMAYFGLSEAKAFAFGDGTTLIKRAVPALERPDVKPVDAMHLCYALGRANEHEGNFETAIRYFDRANDLAYKIFNEDRHFDFEVVRSNTTCLIDFYSQDFFREARASASSSMAPIFIVGMIRSGTTLLDRILSRHPFVSSAGELPFWKLNGPLTTQKWLCGGVDEEDVKSLGAKYLSMLQKKLTGVPRIIDKQPLNYEVLGLIHTVFPQAKVIHIRRDPLDTCLSVYTTHFGGGPNFAYRRENIVFAYEEYLRLVEHWRNVIPDANFLDVDYECLVNDTPGVVQKILDFCALPWDAACLNSTHPSSNISTPSRWQARQPIYSSSIGRWRNYEPWLGIFSELRPSSANNL